MPAARAWILRTGICGPTPGTRTRVVVHRWCPCDAGSREEWLGRSGARGLEAQLPYGGLRFRELAATVLLLATLRLLLLAYALLATVRGGMTAALPAIVLRRALSAGLRRHGRTLLR